VDFAAEVDVTKWRGPEAERPTASLEEAMANELAKKLDASKLDTVPDKVPVPTVDVPNCETQMKNERELFLNVVTSGEVSYHDLTRYGLFLKSVRERLADEHKRATQRQLVAKALADRSRGEREWSQRSAALERANQLQSRLADAAQSLNKHVTELHASPIFVR